MLNITWSKSGRQNYESREMKGDKERLIRGWIWGEMTKFLNQKLIIQYYRSKKYFGEIKILLDEDTIPYAPINCVFVNIHHVLSLCFLQAPGPCQTLRVLLTIWLLTCPELDNLLSNRLVGLGLDSIFLWDKEDNEIYNQNYSSEWREEY